MKILGRDPAVFFALVASFIQFFSSLALPLTTDQQGALNAVVVLVTSGLLAWKVSHEGGLAWLAGIAKALFALALAFGAHLSPEIQSSALVFINMAVAFWVRGQVSAPIDVYGNKVPETFTGTSWGAPE